MREDGGCSERSDTPERKGEDEMDETEVGARSDARHERDRGCAITAELARERAHLRRATGRDADAPYWDFYAAEVESWTGRSADYQDAYRAGWRSTHPEGLPYEVYLVLCEHDQRVRHEIPFYAWDDATTFAHWGHCCYGDHSVQVLPTERLANLFAALVITGHAWDDLGFGIPAKAVRKLAWHRSRSQAAFRHYTLMSAKHGDNSAVAEAASFEHVDALSLWATYAAGVREALGLTYSQVIWVADANEARVRS